MPHFLKTLLLWLLLALLPLQGTAALAACHPAEAHASAAAAASAEHRHDGVDAATSEHIGSMHHHAPGEPLKKLAGAKHKHSSCGACASCCVGACAPPPALALSPADHASLAVVIYPSLFFTGFIPPGLERPPKRIAA